MQPNTQDQQTEVPQNTSNRPSQKAMTGVRKRQQIKDTNKKIFVWLAVSAVIVSACLVAMQFLVREFLYNQKIINKKMETNSTLVANKETAETLRENINELLADSNLNALKYESPTVKTTALNVILDALPVEGDATNFANSLQAVVLPRSAVNIKDLSTSASLEGAIGPDGTPAQAAASASTPLEVPFNAGFLGSYQQIQSALTDMSKVIRPINPKKVTIVATGDAGLQASVDGVTYYLPAKSIEVRKETMKP